MNMNRRAFGTFTLSALFGATLSACGGGGEEEKTAISPLGSIKDFHKKPPVSVTASSPEAAKAMATKVASPLAKAKPLASPAVVDVFNGVPVNKACDDLLNWAEKPENFGMYFTTHETTFDYNVEGWGSVCRLRYYATYGLYLGVITQNIGDYVRGGVYVLGGPFAVATYAGMLMSFVTPTPEYTMYIDKVYALWTDSYPFAVTRTGVTKATNMTQYNILFNCVMSSYALPDGKIPVLGKDFNTEKYHELYIDPMTNELHEYVEQGKLPADLWYTLSDDRKQLTSTSEKWGGVQNPDPTHPSWSTWANTAEGWYFTGQGSDHVSKLYFENDVGNVSLVAQKTPQIDGNVRIMFAYSR